MPMDSSPECVRFIPSRVEGLSDVTEAVVFPDRLELKCCERWVVHPFAEIARWPRPAWLWRMLFSVGLRPRWLPVADRDWFYLPPDRYFVFYTSPPLKVYMPTDERSEGYAETSFVRVQQVLAAGGFATFDLG